jgi:hypothetical protein
LSGAGSCGASSAALSLSDLDNIIMAS